MFINENWKITADPLNVILRQRKMTEEKEDKTSKEYWVVAGYYTTFKYALKALIDKQILGTGLDEYRSICDKLDELYEMVERISDSRKADS